MTENQITRMAQLCEEIEQFINEKMRKMLESDDKPIVVNAMINVSTTTLAKVMMLVQDDMRQAVMQTAISITHDKVKEGDELISQLRVMLKAQALGSTCQPYPPTKH